MVASLTEPVKERLPPEVTPPPVRRMGYQPALDGLRGLALVAIVVFHSQVGGVPGAFLSVSTFFTLSGFLIMTVVLADHSSRGRVGLASFYVRRARRLVPAALVAVTFIVLVTAVIGDSTQLARLRPDALSALFYAGNWRMVLAGDSYGALFQSPSGFTHFWTLGIEEQFYILFPVVVAITFFATRGSRKALAVTFSVLVVASTAWAAVLLASGAGVDRVYFGTDTRLAELLIGALVAIWWARARVLQPAHLRLIRWAGVIALITTLVLWHVADRTAPIFYQGGLAAYAALTTLVILAAVQPAGPVRRVLSWRPLVYVGTISYGAYLLHWPILVWLQLRSPLPSWARLLVGFSITLVLATMLYRLVEQPIRMGRRLPRPRAVRVAVPGIAAVAALIMVATAWRSTPTETIDFQAAAQRINADASPASTVPRPELAGLTPEEKDQFFEWEEQQRAVEESTAPRFALFGDSTALMSGVGLMSWAVANLDQLAPAGGSAELGCGLLSNVVRSTGGVDVPVNHECDGYLDRWTKAITTSQIDIAVVQFGPWEVHDYRLSPDGPSLVIGKDVELEDAMRAQLDRALTTLLDHVGYVVLVTSPDVSFQRVDGQDPPRASPASDPARMARFRQLETEVADRHRDRVGVVDLASYINDNPDEHRLRPDGVHLTEAASTDVAAWLGPRILDAYERSQR